MLEKNARVHAGEHGDMALGPDGEFAQGEIAREFFIRF
jgi:hypothetical protein